MSLDLYRISPDDQSFRAGKTIFATGDSGDCVDVLTEGDVNLSINGQILETVGLDEIVGEMALINHLPHSAVVE